MQRADGSPSWTDEVSFGSLRGAPRSQGKMGWLRPEEHPELMAKGEVLGHEAGPRPKKSAEGAESESDEAEHRNRIRAEGEPSRRLVE